MEYKDYYKILGVKRDATEAEIKKSYRKLARKYHPDVSKEKNAEAKFKELGEAYEVLKEPKKRKAYDQLGANWKTGERFRPPPGWEEAFGGFGGFGGAGAGRAQGGFGGAGGFSDFFESLFGGGFRQAGAGFGGGGRGHYQRQQKGQDISAAITIDLADAMKGAEKTLRLQVPEVSPQGMMTQKLKTIKVKVPKGVSEGQHMRLKGQGGASIAGGPKGDLLLKIHIKVPSHYRLEGHNLYLDLPITPWEAALGANVKVETFSGKIGLKIPPHSQSGKKLRLKGKGLSDKKTGDLYIVLQIYTPPADTATRKEFYKKMAEEFPFNPRET